MRGSAWEQVGNPTAAHCLPGCTTPEEATWAYAAIVRKAGRLALLEPTDYASAESGIHPIPTVSRGISGPTWAFSDHPPESARPRGGDDAVASQRALSSR